MPTVNPRVNVTLSPSLDLLVGRLAAQQRSSKSQVLRELLEAAEPALQRAVALMEAASTAAAEVRDGLSRSLSRAQDDLERRLSVSLHEIDATTDDLVTLAESVRARRPAHSSRGAAPAGKGRSDPPASNRGVNSQRRAGKEAGRQAPQKRVKGGRS